MYGLNRQEVQLHRLREDQRVNQETRLQPKELNQEPFKYHVLSPRLLLKKLINHLRHHHRQETVLEVLELSLDQTLSLKNQ